MVLLLLEMFHVKHFGFSFSLLFVLNSIASPTPAPVNSPDIRLPSEIMFSKYIFVIITDDAQLGISPISDDIIGPISGLFNSQLAIISSPIKCTVVFIVNVIIIINIVIFIVCEIADFSIPFSLQ